MASIEEGAAPTAEEAQEDEDEEGLAGIFGEGSNSSKQQQQSNSSAAAAGEDYAGIYVAIKPSQSQVRISLRSIMYDGMVVLAAPPRLFTHPDLAKYTEIAAADEASEEGGGGGDGDDEETAVLTEVITNHENYKSMALSMLQAVEGAFQDVDDFCLIFKPYARAFLANETAADSMDNQYPIDTKLEVFQKAISQYQAQLDDYDKIPAFANVGIIRIDSVALKRRVIPSPTRCLDAIRSLLPKIMLQLTTVLMDDVRALYNVLSSAPTEVDQFMAKLEVLDRTMDELPLLRDRESHVRALGQLMADQHWAFGDQLKAQFKTLRDSLGDLDMVAQSAEASKEEDVKRFAKQVEMAIPGIKKSTSAVREKLEEASVSDPNSPPSRMVKSLREHAAKLDELRKQFAKFQGYQATLKQPIAEFEALEEVAADGTLKLKLWEATLEWSTQTQAWRDRALLDIDVEDVSKQVQAFVKTASRMERALPGNGAALRLKTAVGDFKTFIPIIADLRSKALRPRHWEEIQAIIGKPIDATCAYSLGELLDMGIVSHQAAISVVAVKAVSELSLEEMLERKVTNVWGALEFIVNPYKDSKEVFILGSTEDIVVALDESLVTINTILGSRFCGHIRANVESYQKRLILLSDTLDEWLNCQKQWMYLEAILFAEDIKRDLPEESKRFTAVDRSWKSIMKRTYMQPRALDGGTVKGLKETLVRHNEVLDQIQKSLESYLEKKRSIFPRFYFLSNDELLQILAQARNPQAVQPHLRKCFDALTQLEFGKGEDSVDIIAMISPEKERVALPKNLNARGPVEHWLRQVQEAMVVSLRGIMKEGVGDYLKRDRHIWVRAHAGQVVATAAQIQWCHYTEQALKHPTNPAAALLAWSNKNVEQLKQLTDLVRSDLTDLQRRVIVALVTTDVHARDIVDALKDSGTTSVGAFAWQQQLRYYWDDVKSDVIVKQSNSVIYYGYEYQGATTRLVITPLTDRCWMTITGAFQLKLGASPAGPAGTGKTESSKDLAKALAIQCIVFNCSDQINCEMLGKLFSGLAQSGAWTCLDEFNRIDIEVLSVVAQQLQILRQGLLSNATSMLFEGRTISLKPHCVIITMNPGYAGRTELPDNLKVQFRPVAMMVPDYALIAEISLFAEGFDDAKKLSRKMTRLYRLSSEQLSQQKHYDFGMRAVKSVLVMAGALKRANPTLPEDAVLIRAMRDSNVPKFLQDDLPLFQAIVGDLFPGVVVPIAELGDLQTAVLSELQKAGLQRVDSAITKMMQLYETFNVRFGVVLVGPTGAGKTTAYQTIAKACTALREKGSTDPNHQRVRMQVLNPKCVNMGELYGEFNDVTQEWKDGLASSIIREYSEDETADRKWTVFDGPIDALWIENMNTVLDDNMMLCLANGQRIKLKTSQRMLFEVQDLEVASPATVSRLGVVFMTPSDLGWLPVVKSWLAKELPPQTPPALRDYIYSLFETTLEDGLAFRRSVCSEPIPTTDLQVATTLCRLLTAMIRSAGGAIGAAAAAGGGGGGGGAASSNSSASGDAGSAAAAGSASGGALPGGTSGSVFPPPGLKMEGIPLEELKRAIDALYVFAYAWSVGGSVSSEGHEKIDTFMRSSKTTVLSSVRYGSGLIYESFPDIAQGHLPWRKWSEVFPIFSYNREQPYFSMVVPTLDTVRYTWLLSLSLSQLYPVFFTGLTGTGKTVIAASHLSAASASDYREGTPIVPININFSARTSSIDTQMAIEARLEKKKKTQLGAPVGKHVVIFVDDINMPAVETFGAQPPVELLRQLLDSGGFYDRSKLYWKEVVDSVLVCAAAPPGGGRAPITQRLTRNFHMLCVPVASDEVFKNIFGSILTGFAAIFSEEIRAICPKVVAATIEVFDRIRDKMKPTPAKSHYTFNLRDVSKVFQGLLMIAPKECATTERFLHLWIHEMSRVFHDRLISAADKLWFTQLMVELSGRFFARSGQGWTHADLFETKPILFVDFLRPGLEEGAPGIYEEVASMEKLTAKLDEGLEDYNVVNPNQMRLVFFRDAIEHITRISRVLRQPRGNAMLIGVGGSGKQSLTRIACHLEDVEIFSIELVRGYGSTEFREDLKKIMLRTGVAGQALAFLFTDTQIVHDSFLEDVSNILNTGEVPGLFTSDEMSKVVEDLRPVAQALGIPETRDNVNKLFISRIRDKLHIILAMSPVGTALRVRCRQFPSLINCCTIDWYSAWPDAALQSVAQRFLADEEAIPPELRDPISDMCKMIHQSVADFGDQFFAELQRRVYTTPKSYLDLINLYTSMLSEKRSQISLLRNSLFSGSEKIRNTNEIIAKLSEELKIQAPKIEVKKKEVAVATIETTKNAEAAQKIQVQVEEETKIVEVQALKVEMEKEEAERDLAIALPALKAAEESLRLLNKGDIAELRGIQNPTPTIRTLAEAICLMLNEERSWDNAKKVMGRSTFMNELLEYKKDDVPPAKIEALQKYLADPVLAPELVKRATRAAVTLANWLASINIYSNVSKTVGPKRELVARMEEEATVALLALEANKAKLEDALTKVSTLKTNLEKMTSESTELEAAAQLTKARLERANKLTSGLADEGVRWGLAVEKYDLQIKNLVGDVLICAACISYFGAFTGDYRERMVSSWAAGCRSRGIPVSEGLSLMGTLGDPVKLREWHIFGLPTDAVSADSAILVTRGRRWPLLIDPQEQAKKWIKNMEKNRLQIARFGDSRWLNTLENCIRLGNALLIEDVGETLDPALEPVLQRATFRNGGRLLIHLGDSDVDYSPDFNLYLTTKVANPHYLPEVSIKVTIINFTVTLSGLADQLLGATVRKERPDVEKKKNDLVISMAKDLRALKDAEDRILTRLRESQGNILDDKELIDELAQSKSVSNSVEERLRSSIQTDKEISEMRSGYQPVATRGAILYFVVADLALIDPMYQFSLNYFCALYERCIDSAERSTDLPTRLSHLMKTLTLFTYSNVCRGLFEIHKPLFSFLIAIQIMRGEGMVREIDWSLFLRGAGLSVNPEPISLPDILPEDAWNLAFALDQAVPPLKGLCAHIASAANAGDWLAWARCDEPHLRPLPSPWEAALTPFERLLLLKVFRPEKLLFAIKRFVAAQLGQAFAESPPVALADVMRDSRPETPIIFILSVGADPSNMLFAYAKTQGYGDRLRPCSLGQGQGPKAAELIEAASVTGDWVLLQNCHLAKSWMPQLQRIVESFAERQKGNVPGKAPMSADFRLFLTSMPSDYFPVPVLQNGAKLTNEPPKGLRANLGRSLAQINGWTPFETCGGGGGGVGGGADGEGGQGEYSSNSSSSSSPVSATFDDGSAKLPAWKKMAFSLCFFHAIVQERRKFGPLGFNIRYEINDSDLETSIIILKMLLSEQRVVPWDALRYVTAEINYGGRVTDDWDRRCLNTILTRYYNPELLAAESYAFSPSGQYHMPALGPLEGYKTYAQSLPLNDPPEIFGMHENANIANQAAETIALLDTALQLQPRASSLGGGRTPDQILAEIASEIEAGLPGKLRLEDAGPTAFQMKGEHMDSLGTVLLQELARFNKLRGEMASSLSDLQRALRGEVLLSEMLDKMYTALLNNRVPANWEAAAYPSLKPLASWVKDLHARFAFMRLWLKEGLPPAFWLSGFFFPQGFLTGVLQNHSRKYHVAIDTLTFSFQMLTAESPDQLAPGEYNPEADGVFVYGLYMDGARWNRETKLIDDSKPGEMFSPWPLIRFIPTKDYVSPPTHYTAPVYKTSTRAGVLSTTGISSSFVIAVDIPSAKKSEHWILSGAALVLQTNS